MTEPGNELLIFPLGHYIGAYHPEDGAPLAYHTVRIGPHPVRLRSDDELVLWGLAHAAPDAPGPWTREAVLELADDAEIPDAETLLQELMDEDVLVEVRPGSDDAIDFAEAHRVMPLLHGLGRSADGDRRRLGLGNQVAVEVNDLAFELWRFGGVSDSLWTFCELYGKALQSAAGLSEAETDPARLLGYALVEAQTLLGGNAAYLDSARAFWE